MKVCSKCKIEKPLSEFHKHPTGKNGLSSYCKVCHSAGAKEYNKKNKKKIAETSSKYYLNNKERCREVNLINRYGIDLSTYVELEKEQEGVCAVCGKEQNHSKFEHLCVDHNHDTGDVRGLLCHTCNTAIGLLYEDADLFQKAADYLRRYEYDHKNRAC